MTRAILLFLAALPAAALAQREAGPTPTEPMIAPAPCIDTVRMVCTVPEESSLACDVCNPIVPGKPMSTDLVTEAPSDALHHPTPLERTIRSKQKDLATRPVSPTL